MPHSTYGDLHASITIGGRVPRALLPTLLRAAREDSFMRDDPELPPSVGALLETARDSGLLTLSTSCTSSGRFDQLEVMLQAAHLPFNRHSLGIDGELASSRRGQVPVVRRSNQAGDVCLRRKDVERILHHLRTGHIAAAIERLAAKMYQGGPLPPVSIV
jgi:hypothetical protein